MKRCQSFWSPPIAGWRYLLTEVDLGSGLFEYVDRTMTVRCTKTRTGRRPYVRLEVFSNSQEPQHYEHADNSIDDCARFLTKRIERQQRFLELLVEDPL